MIWLTLHHIIMLVFLTYAQHYPMMMCCVIVWQSMLKLVEMQKVVLGTGDLQPHNVVSSVFHNMDCFSFTLYLPEVFNNTPPEIENGGGGMK